MTFLSRGKLRDVRIAALNWGGEGSYSPADSAALQFSVKFRPPGTGWPTRVKVVSRQLV